MSNKKCGIYFLLKKGTVIYIGQTTNLVHRMRYHNVQEMDYDCARFIKCDSKDLSKYEKRWIERFKPIENHAHKGRKPPKSYYLKKERITKAPMFRYKNKSMKFRKMTEKSIIGIGKFRNETVGRLLKEKRYLDLVSIYYNLSHITFFDNILMELKITEEWRIQKPGENVEKYLEFCQAVWPSEFEQRKEKIHKRLHNLSVASLASERRLSSSRASLMSKNRGF